MRWRATALIVGTLVLAAPNAGAAPKGCEANFTDLDHPEVEDILDPRQPAARILGRLHETNLLRPTTARDIEFMYDAGLLGERGGTEEWRSTRVQLGQTDRSVDGPVAYWMVARSAEGARLFVARDWYGQKVLAEVGSPALASELADRVFENQVTRVLHDRVSLEGNCYFAVACQNLKRLIVEEDGTEREADLDYHAQHWSFANPRLETGLRPAPAFYCALREAVGFESHVLNERPGFRVVLPRAPLLNERLAALGELFAHLRVADVTTRREPAGENCIVALNTERARAIAREYARGLMVLRWEEWVPVGFHEDSLGLLLLAPREIEWIQAAARHALASGDADADRQVYYLVDRTLGLAKNVGSGTFGRMATSLRYHVDFIELMARVPPSDFATLGYQVLTAGQTSVMRRANERAEGGPEWTDGERSALDDVTKRLAERRRSIEDLFGLY